MVSLTDLTRRLRKQALPLIPESFTPEFLEAVITIAKKRKAWLKANPVSTHCGAIVNQKIEERLRESAQLTGIILNATALTELEQLDFGQIEEAAKELQHWLDEDRFGIERDALALARRAAA